MKQTPIVIYDIKGLHTASHYGDTAIECIQYPEKFEMNKMDMPDNHASYIRHYGRTAAHFGQIALCENHNEKTISTKESENCFFCGMVYYK